MIFLPPSLSLSLSFPLSLVMWDYKYQPLSTENWTIGLLLDRRNTFLTDDKKQLQDLRKNIRPWTMLLLISNICRCSPLLMLAFGLPLILLLNDGYSEASVYHIKGEDFFFSIWLSCSCAGVTACPPSEHESTLAVTWKPNVLCALTLHSTLDGSSQQYVPFERPPNVTDKPHMSSSNSQQGW